MAGYLLCLFVYLVENAKITRRLSRAMYVQNERNAHAGTYLVDIVDGELARIKANSVRR